MSDDKINKYLLDNKISSNNFDYLLNMSFKQLTKNNLDKIEEKLKNYKIEYNKLKDLSNKELWLNDLNDLKINLNK